MGVSVARGEVTVDARSAGRAASGYARTIYPEVFANMAGMQPQLAVEGCRFSQVEPWLDARRVEDLGYFDGPPGTPEKVARSFAAIPDRSGTCLSGNSTAGW
jgi:hypothetical protein